jgi:hypothetical protein
MYTDRASLTAATCAWTLALSILESGSLLVEPTASELPPVVVAVVTPLNRVGVPHAMWSLGFWLSGL